MTTLALASQPAARQMLINYVNDNNVVDNIFHDQWQLELTNLGYPQGDGQVPFRKIAISNGSECASLQTIAPNSNLFSYVGQGNGQVLSEFGIASTLLTTVSAFSSPPIFFLSTLPGRNKFDLEFRINSKASGASNQVYKGKITYTKKILGIINVNVPFTDRSYNSSSSAFAYDHLPGGAYDVEEMSNVKMTSPSANTYYIKYNITASGANRFLFVPTTSALDIGSGNIALVASDYTAKYVGASPPSPPKNSPFNNFITAFNGSTNTANENHIAINIRNANWLAAEMSQSPTLSDCSFFCNSTIAISGLTGLCTPPSQLYTLSPVPNGTSISWFSSNTSIATVSGNGSSAIVNRVGNGQITLTANIFKPECGLSKTVTFLIYVGTPQTPGQIYWTYNAPPNRVGLSVGAVPTATSYKWYCNGAYKATTGTPYYNLPINGNVSCGQTATFGVEAVSSCGTSPRANIFAEMPPCEFAFTVSPNPGSSNVNITSKESGDSHSSGSISKIHKIEIVDKTGIVVKRIDYGTVQSKVSITVSAFPNDVYTLRIFDGYIWSVGKLIVQH